MSAIPGVQYSLDSSAALWTAPSRPSLPARVGVDRALLVPGDYVPWLVDDTVGARENLISRSEYGTVQPNSAGAYSAYSRYVLTPAGGTLYENVRFRCPVFAEAGSPSAVTFRNCVFNSTNPHTVQALYNQYVTSPTSIPSSIKECGAGVVNYRPTHLTFIDCTFDCGWYYDQGLSDMVATQWSAGLHGGNFTFDRVLVRRWVDGVNFAQGACGSAAYTLINQSAIVDGAYANNIVPPPGTHWASQSGGQTHSDAFQFNQGRNVEIRYSLLGGHRNDFADRQNVPYIPCGSSGNDYSDTAILLQQDGTNSYGTNGIIDNVDIHDSWMGGSIATVQVTYKNGNLFPAATNHIRNNRVLQRHPGWGNTASESGSYMMLWPGVTVDHSGNVTWDGTDSGRDGTATPITIDIYAG